MKILKIDTSDSKNVMATLLIDKKKYSAKSNSKTQNPESINNLIEKVLKESNLKLGELDKIEVDQGPGSYTGLKVGVSVANMLSFSLLKNVNKESFGQILKPNYD